MPISRPGWAAILVEIRARNKVETRLKPLRARLARLMLYAAKCYWPDISRHDLDQVADRAARRARAVEPPGAAYLGSLLFAADDLVLCLFEGTSRAEVKRASEQLGIPCERVMDSVWLGPSLTKQEGAKR